MFRRRQVKNHTRLMREELGESFGHFRMAAAHAAEGASGALAPRVDAARSAVKPGYQRARAAAGDGLDSIFGAARDGSRGGRRIVTKSRARARKKESGMGSRRWPMMIGGLLATGAFIGAASALMKRRRTTNTWDEYASTRTSSDTSAKLDSAKSTMDASMPPEATKERTSDLIG